MSSNTPHDPTGVPHAAAPPGPPSTPQHTQHLQPGRPLAQPGQAPTVALATEPAPKRGLDLSAVQVGASALTAVTAALASSWVGTAGTLVGAAGGAVISTVAGAVYTQSLKQAGSTLRSGSQVLVRRVPAGPSRPGSVPTTTLQQAPPTQAVPVTAVGAGGFDPPPGTGTDGGDGGGDGSARRRRGFLALGAIAVLGFVLAMVVLTLGETAIGRPVGGGDGGTTLGNVAGVSQQRDTGDREPAEEATPTPTSTDESERDEPPADEATPAPTPTGGTSAPDEPTAEPTEEPDATSTGGTGTDGGETTDEGTDAQSDAQSDGAQGAPDEAEVEPAPAS